MTATKPSDKPPDTFHNIPGAPGYAINRRGVVLSARRRTKQLLLDTPTEDPGEAWQPIKIHLDRRRYRQVRLSIDGKKRWKRLHRLLLETFVGPPPDASSQGMHRDGDQENNHLDNLAWGSPAENQEDRRRHGTLPMGETHISSKLTREAALEIAGAEDTPEAINALAEKYGVNATTVAMVRRGRTWRHVTGLKPVNSPTPLRKLNDDAAKEIMMTPPGKENAERLSKQYGVHVETIRFVWQGRTWTRVTGFTKTDNAMTRRKDLGK